MAELLLGKGNPSGKLTDTFAASLDDYPSTENFHESCDYVNYTEDIYVGYRYFETIPGAKEKVIYPFGYGLSYTDFRVHTDSVWETSKHIFAEVHVTNTGNMAGKEVVQLYFNGPQGLLGNPALRLAAFEKTRLLQPGETQVVYLSFEKADMASYDDLGKIQKSAYILEKGIYRFYIGISVRDTEEAAYTFELTENIIVKQLSAHLVPTSLKERMLSDGTFEMLPQYECNDMNECAFEKLKTEEEDCIVPEVRWCSRRKWFDNCGRKQFIDVAEGKLSLDEFMAQLSDKELLHLLGGQPNTGVANTFGLGNLPEYGVPSVMTADGPAGLRLNIGCTVNTTAWPCATLLACTWNPALVWQVGKAGAKEVKENNLAVWLTPAVNIHRNPMCGRNFEYYSEDPLIAGKMGAAMVKGIQSQHIAASVKHFTANNKETNRKNSDSRVSERALREIYLKGFEIIVKEAQPWTIMSSYNAVNGHRTSESYELLTDILRGEWGFEGIVMTDWWAEINNAPKDKPSREKFAAMVLAQNDLYMVTSDTTQVMGDLEAALASGRLERRHLTRCAENICRFLMNSPALLRLTGKEAEIELVNVPENAQLTSDFDIVYHDIKGVTTLPLTGISSEKGDSHMFGITTEGFGTFRISITASSESTPLAQMPVSVFVDNQLFGTYSFNGSEGKEVTLSREGGVFGFHHYVRLYFGQGGLTPISITFEPIDIVTSFSDKD